MRLKNKVILVTAATRGIGLAIVEACAGEGARVYLAGRDLQKAGEIADRLGENVRPVYLDATKPETFAAAAEAVAGKAGRVDVLVNNFGISDRKTDLTLRQTPVESFLATVEVNLRSVYLGVQAVLPHMGRGSSIVNISSIGGSVPDRTQVGYGTAKAAINHLTKLIALQEAKHGIRCNAVLPGMTATDAVQQHLSDDFRRLFLKHIPMGRMGLPEEIAGAVCYLASDEAAYVTGQLLTLSGGFALGTPVYGDLADRKNRR